VESNAVNALGVASKGWGSDAGLAIEDNDVAINATSSSLHARD
jgi:hypothetical protein